MVWPPSYRKERGSQCYDQKLDSENGGEYSERGHFEDSLMHGEGLGLIHRVIRPRA